MTILLPIGGLIGGLGLQVSSAHEFHFVQATAGSPGGTTPDWKSAPPTVRAFKPLANTVNVRWDEEFAYIEANAFPDHEMMTGITAWNQQVPLPQDYSGDNAWRIPLKPQPAGNRVSAKESLFKGAIAVALNGVPIFNPIKQDGRTDTFLAGELDEFGGHAGRADDYHYHIAPWHLQEVVGDSAPIAFALDGYPLFGTKEADGSDVDTKSLDEFNGHQHGDSPYHYHASRDYPYINGGFHGEVELRDGQVAVQPRAQGVRPYTRPLRGATITGFERTSERSYTLAYEVDERVHYIRVETQDDGGAKFNFLDPDGEAVSETYTRRPNKGAREGRPRGGEEGKPRRKGKGKSRDERPPRS
ncbi:MAG: YHYH protein [Verrucomicrobiota bacterium]